jgi:hypothetical protein
MDVVALKHAPGKVRLVGVSLPQAVDRGVLVPESDEELEGELSLVERLSGELGYGFFNFDGVHVGTLERVPSIAKPATYSAKYGGFIH